MSELVDVYSDNGLEFAATPLKALGELEPEVIHDLRTTGETWVGGGAAPYFRIVLCSPTAAL